MRRFRNILVRAPQGQDTAHVVGHATELARRNDGRLTIYDTVSPLPARRSRINDGGTIIDVHEVLVANRVGELEQLAAPLDVDTEVAVDVGVPFVATIQRVMTEGHDLIMTLADPTEPGKRLRGASTTLHLLRKSPCPVWVDDPVTHERPDVVVGIGPYSTDGEVDPLDQMLVELGTSLAKIQGGAAHLVHAWKLEGESLLRSGAMRLQPSAVDELVAAERASAMTAFDTLVVPSEVNDITIHHHIEKGSAADVIGDVAERTRAGVVVMGTLARAGLPGLIIGNTAERLLGGLEASIIAVKPPGFESPVTVA